jgi:hypothetical protein
MITDLLICFGYLSLIGSMLLVAFIIDKFGKRLEKAQQEILNLYEEVHRKNHAIFCIEKVVARLFDDVESLRDKIDSHE